MNRFVGVECIYMYVIFQSFIIQIDMFSYLSYCVDIALSVPAINKICILVKFTHCICYTNNIPADNVMKKKKQQRHSNSPNETVV